MAGTTNQGGLLHDTEVALSKTNPELNEVVAHQQLTEITLMRIYFITSLLYLIWIGI